MRAADSNHIDIVRYLRGTWAAPYATDKVSKWLSMYACVCVCVLFFFHDTVSWLNIIILFIIFIVVFRIWWCHYHQLLHYYYLFLLRMITLLTVLLISYVNICATNIFLSFSFWVTGFYIFYNFHISYYVHLYVHV